MEYVSPFFLGQGAADSEEQPHGVLMARALPPKALQRPRVMAKPVSSPVRSLAPIERRKGGNRRGAVLERRLYCRRVIHGPVVLDTRANYDRRHGKRRRHEATVMIDTKA